jgi:hypothetical protein
MSVVERVEKAVDGIESDCATVVDVSDLRALLALVRAGEEWDQAESAWAGSFAGIMADDPIARAHANVKHEAARQRIQTAKKNLRTALEAVTRGEG